MTDIVPSGQGRLLTARGNVMAFKAVAAERGLMSRYGMEPA
jgi:hypothetical protein